VYKLFKNNCAFWCKPMIYFLFSPSTVYCLTEKGDGYCGCLDSEEVVFQDD
jgi:hypothetical protein